jgi:hypothetical protein
MQREPSRDDTRRVEIGPQPLKVTSAPEKAGAWNAKRTTAKNASGGAAVTAGIYVPDR